jgi:hypothetical protein
VLSQVYGAKYAYWHSKKTVAKVTLTTLPYLAQIRPPPLSPTGRGFFVKKQVQRSDTFKPRMAPKIC